LHHAKKHLATGGCNSENPPGGSTSTIPWALRRNSRQAQISTLPSFHIK
jgi:hypothetical protein